MQRNLAPSNPCSPSGQVTIAYTRFAAQNVATSRRKQELLDDRTLNDPRSAERDARTCVGEAPEHLRTESLGSYGSMRPRRENLVDHGCWPVVKSTQTAGSPARAKNASQSFALDSSSIRKRSFNSTDQLHIQKLLSLIVETSFNQHGINVS